MEVLCLFIPHPPPGEARPGAAGKPGHRDAGPAQAAPRPVAAGPLPGEGSGARSFEAVLDILDRFSPAVEAGAPGKVFLDVTGSRKLYGPAASLADLVTQEVLRGSGLRSRAAVAGGKFVAGVAAPLATAGPLVVPPGQEKQFLAPLPVELLPVSPQALSWLRRLGLRRLGQVAALPENALAGQLGAEGVTAYRLASGIDLAPVIPRPRPDVLEETLSFEAPPESLGALLAALDRLLDRLVPLLRKRYQVCSQIRLCFILDAAAPSAAGPGAVEPGRARSDGVRPRPDSVNLKTPLDSKPEILGVLKRHLEAAAFPEGMSGVRLSLARLGGEAGRQAPLSSAARRRQAEALQRLEKDLGARFGPGSLKKVVALDPGSRIPERRMALVDAAVEPPGQRDQGQPGHGA